MDDEISTPKFSPSPKRFAKQDLVYLAEIESLDELNELSVAQLKKLLAMNRVTFKGVVEKEELLKIVTRLWKQEQRAEEGNMWKIPYKCMHILNIFLTMFCKST